MPPCGIIDVRQGAQDGIHFACQFPTGIRPWLDTEVRLGSVCPLKDVLDIVRRCANISSSRFDFATEMCMWCIVPLSQILLSKCLQRIYAQLAGNPRLAGLERACDTA